MTVIFGTAYLFLKNFTLLFYKSVGPKFVSCNPLATRVASAEYSYTFSAFPRFLHLEIPVKPEMQRSLFELMLKVLNSMPLISVGFL